MMPATTKRPRLVAVRKSPMHGRGIFALAEIPRGTRVLEYTGERISQDEADRRYGEAQEKDAHTMLFATDAGVIDGTRRGSIARWTNHSCTPNCETVEEEGRVFVETIRKVRDGEELTYDYRLTLDKRHTAKVKRAYACFCGTRKCRGTMLAPKRR